MDSSSCAAAASNEAVASVATAIAVQAAVVAAVGGQEGKESLAASIIRLKAEQQQAREAKKRLARDLHNAQRRASRLKKRARQLTDIDLVEVLKMREVHAPVVEPAAVLPPVEKPSAPDDVLAEDD